VGLSCGVGRWGWGSSRRPGGPKPCPTSSHLMAERSLPLSPQTPVAQAITPLPRGNLRLAATRGLRSRTAPRERGAETGAAKPCRGHADLRRAGPSISRQNRTTGSHRRRPASSPPPQQPQAGAAVRTPPGTLGCGSAGTPGRGTPSEPRLGEPTPARSPQPPCEARIVTASSARTRGGRGWGEPGRCHPQPRARGG